MNMTDIYFLAHESVCDAAAFVLRLECEHEVFPFSPSYEIRELKIGPNLRFFLTISPVNQTLIITDERSS